MSSAILRMVSATLGTPNLSAYYPTDSWTLTEQAEEGSVGESTLLLYDDASGSLATAFGQLQNLAMTDDSTGGDIFVWGGYSADWTWSRGDTAVGRTLGASLKDANFAWERMLLTGTASSRPAETDVARVQWALSTYAADVAFDDVTTYVSTASPVAMDAADYRGQYLSDLMGDCSQASGKNWWAQQIGTAIGTAYGKVTAWYADSNTSTAYSSSLVITNDGTLLATGSPYVAASQDSELLVDPSRIYSGVYVEYEGGATYRESASIASAYGKRAVAISAPNVKTAAKAQARAARYLASWATPHLRFTTTVRVGAAQSAQLRAGMRVPVRMTGMPGIVDAQWCRIMRRGVSQRAAGTLYDIEMELVPTGAAASVTTYCTIGGGSLASTASGFYGPLGGTTTDSRGNIWYTGSNSAYFTPEHTPNLGPYASQTCRGFSFPDYGTTGGDAGGTGTNSTIRFVFTGRGTIAWSMLAYGATNAAWSWTLHYNGAGGSDITQQTGTGLQAGDSVTLATDALPADATGCYRWLDIVIGLNIGGGGTKLVFPGLTWTSL